MKRIQCIISAIYIVINCYGQDTAYYQVLKKSIVISFSDYKVENLRQLANTCERINSAFQNEWIPYYYGSYAYSNLSFISEKEDEKEKFCNKAQEMLEEAFKLKPSESELYVLQAIIYYARMTTNPMVNGPLYLPKANRALASAEKLNPDNPRTYYLKGKSIMSTPKFLGGGKEAALPVLERAIEKFKIFKPESYISPDWGYNDAIRLFTECNKEK